MLLGPIGPEADFSASRPAGLEADIGFEQNCFARCRLLSNKAGVSKNTLLFKSEFSDPRPYPLEADIGFEQTCFFQKRVDAESPLGTIFALSVGKLFFQTPLP